jgi:hypothetical protein
MPGSDSSVYSRKVEAAWAVRGAGSDQMKSKVPSSRCWLTLSGTIRSPSGIRARVGVPVAMYKAVTSETSG